MAGSLSRPFLRAQEVLKMDGLSQQHALSTEGHEQKAFVTPRGSVHVNYEKECENYDQFRRPLGDEHLCDQIQKMVHRRSLTSLHLGSYCCGTGEHEARILRGLQRRGVPVASLTCMDASAGMLKVAECKLLEVRKQLDLKIELEFRHKDVIEQDFDLPHQLDASWAIQCIHHLCTRANRYQRLGIFFSKAFSATAPGGIFLPLSSTPTQARDPRWYLNVLQHLTEENPVKDPSYHYGLTFPDYAYVRSLLIDSSFEVSGMRILHGPYVPEAVHLTENPEVLFDPQFRNAESFFQLMAKKGLTEAYDQRLRELITSGSLGAHIEHCELIRKQIGVAYYLRAVKPRSFANANT